MDWTIRFTDLAIVFATLLGPVLAIQAQKYLERRRQVNDRQDWVFRTLMTTRASSLSPAHVEALNAIPITFYGRSKELIAINDAWKTYLTHLGARHLPADEWAAKRLDLLFELMHRISTYLKYDFTILELKRDVYSPEAHGKADSDINKIREGLAAVFSGTAAIPMDVKSFPFQEPPPTSKA